MVKKRVSLSEAIEGYSLAAHARRLSPHTLADYDHTFRRFETFLSRDPPLAGITAGDVRAFLSSLRREFLTDRTSKREWTRHGFGRGMSAPRTRRRSDPSQA
jgi:site-specific recombinase XerD